MRILLLLLFAATVSPKLLVEVGFDIASATDTGEGGHSVAQIFNSFLEDPNLSSMRHLNTLIDGSADETKSRAAFFEFESSKEWGWFEKNQKGPTHVLYDLFWVNWKRMPWLSDPLKLDVDSKTERKAGREGYLYVFKFSVRDSMSWPSIIKKSVEEMQEKLSSTDGFITRKAYVEGNMQSRFTHMTIYEFDSVEKLMKAVYEDNGIVELAPTVREALDSYSATIYQPPYQKGGNIMKGKHISEKTSVQL